MPAVARTLFRLGARLDSTAQNALAVARFGGFDTDEDVSPCEVVTEQRVYRLRHSFPESAGGPVVLLVPPLMITAEVYDISSRVSAVGVLHDFGVDHRFASEGVERIPDALLGGFAVPGWVTRLGFHVLTAAREAC